MSDIVELRRDHAEVVDKLRAEHKAEIARLRALLQPIDASESHFFTALQECDRLRDEIERLRTALREIAELGSVTLSPATRIARAALEGK